MDIRHKQIILFFALAAFLIASCAPQPQVEVGYQPPFVPIRISVNSRGEVSAEFSKKFNTPYGTFDVGGGIDVNTLRNDFPNKILVVVVDDVAAVYELEDGKEFKVTFDDSNTLYKKVALEYESNGDIVLELVSVREDAPSGGSPSSSNSSSGSNNNYWCDDLSGVRLKVGDEAEVVWDKVNLRSTPKVPDVWDENIVAMLDQGAVITIVDGPVCAHEGTWWKVRTTGGTTGWMREYVSAGYLIGR